uniref:Interleukin 13 receptor, alpha 1 n=1 Tax=Cyprinus carpio TaxID=7962 RepID=A0A8C1QP62_CYPCA
MNTGTNRLYFIVIINMKIRCHQQDCSEKAITISYTTRVKNTTCKLNIPNVNGLCISVKVNPEECGNKKQSPPLEISIPPPPVRLVKNMSFEYYHDRLKCTWDSDVDVPDLGLYYWYVTVFLTIVLYISLSFMKIGECVINDTFHNKEMFYLFNGTYKGQPVNNTFRQNSSTYFVKLEKPKLTIQRIGQSLCFHTNFTVSEFGAHCYEKNYIYSKCDEVNHILDSVYKVDYDSSCKYRARVQIILSSRCGAGKSDLSDEVEYGENRDSNLPALLAGIIIPLMLSCFLIVSLVLLRR